MKANSFARTSDTTSKRVREARIAAKMRQEDLASRAQLSLNTVRAIERGTSTPPSGDVARARDGARTPRGGIGVVSAIDWLHGYLSDRGLQIVAVASGGRLDDAGGVQGGDHSMPNVAVVVGPSTPLDMIHSFGAERVGDVVQLAKANAAQIGAIDPTAFARWASRVDGRMRACS